MSTCAELCIPNLFYCLVQAQAYIGHNMHTVLHHSVISSRVWRLIYTEGIRAIINIHSVYYKVLWLMALTRLFYGILMHTSRCPYSTIHSPENPDLISNCHINSPQYHTTPVQLCNTLLCKGNEHSLSSVM